MAGITLNELAYSNLSKIRPKIQNTEVIDIREIKYAWHNQRALWLRNELNKPGRTIDPNFIQDLGCVELEYVDAADCCGSITIGCKVKRSVKQIPNTIERHNGTTITRVGPINKLQVPYSLIRYDQADTFGNGRGNTKVIAAFVHNSYLWAIQKANTIEFQGLKWFTVQGVFENPTEASKFSTCDGATCYNDDMPYPINRWLVNYINEQVYNLFVNAAFMPVDESIDSKHSVTGTPAKSSQR